MSSVIIFGGTGFIGTHLSQYLLEHVPSAHIVVVDIKKPREFEYTRSLQEGLRSGRVSYIEHDVRKPIPEGLLPANVDAIFNFAAIHREPGHLPFEYFETNLLGAENVCAYATSVNCNMLVFTSSISPYGPSETVKTERSLPVPESPYGASKLVAEKIHLAWQAAQTGRQVLIMRPGVVFGPGEGGNVTRLVRSLVKGYFFYMGNKQTRKAAGYVKELCRVMLYGMQLLQETGQPSLVLNFSEDPTPSMEEIVNAIRTVGKIRRSPLTVPRSFLLGASYPIRAVSTIFRIQQPINPVRIRKMFRSTYVEAERLRELGYQRQYTLVSAFEDWKKDLPSDFLP